MPRAYGAALQELELRFGGPLRTTTRTVAMAGAGVPVEIAQADADRVLLIVLNQGVGNVGIAPSSNILLTGSLTLPVGSGERTFNINDHGTLPTENWFGIGAVADNVLVISCKRETDRSADPY
jgi:hypothetical protein